MTNKRGSHVGMVISFTLFITFITFIYAIITPIVSTGEDREALLEYIEDKVLENISSNLNMVSVKIDTAKNPGDTCVEFQDFFRLSRLEPNNGIIVKDQSNQIQIPYYNQNGDFSNISVNRTDTEINFLKFYISDRFDKAISAPQPCTLINVGDYNISSTSKLNYIFEEDMNNLVDYYNNERIEYYQDLKSRFNIPASTDFALSFTLSDGSELVAEKEIPSKVNVYVKETPMLYVSEDAEIMSGFIKIKVW